MILVGIAGLSGSGKTHLASHLADLSPGTSVLCTDSYYRDLSGIPASERNAVNFDSPSALDWDLLRSQLSQLAAGLGIAVPRYDFTTHARRRSASWLEPCRALVLEGLFALADPEVFSMLDLAVFVDASEEVCLARRVARDTADRGRSEASVRRQWRRDVIPMFRQHVWPRRAVADLVVDGDGPPEVSARAVLVRLARKPASALERRAAIQETIRRTA